LETATLTYGQLFERGSKLAKCFLEMTSEDGCKILKKGDRVLLVYPPSLDFIVAFVACLIAGTCCLLCIIILSLHLVLQTGIIPVPVFPPEPTVFLLPEATNSDSANNINSGDKRVRERQIFDKIRDASGAKIALTSNFYK